MRREAKILTAIVRIKETHILNTRDFCELIEGTLRTALYGHTEERFTRRLKVNDPRRIAAGKRSWITRRLRQQNKQVRRNNRG